MIGSVPGDRRLRACMCYCLYFGDVLGCVMSKTKRRPIIESDSDDSDANDLDQVHVPCIVKLLQ